MFGFGKKKNCTEEVNGRIVKVWFNENGSRRLTVEYTVNGQKYVLKENITVRSEPIKVKGVVIGQRKIEYITAGLNKDVVVLYNPVKPKQAYLRDNKGKYL